MKQDVFWESEESLLLLNPRLPKEDRRQLQRAVNDHPLPGTVWLKSSGTESSARGSKLVALSKSAILSGAAAVNKFFQVDGHDSWLSPLPRFHIGGLAIEARCFLSGAGYVNLEHWNVSEFLKTAQRSKVTITSLVPTQIYDLIQAEAQAPASLRFVLVGGGALDQELYRKARQLDWPLLPSYGMTETSALVASATLASLQVLEYPKAKILPHVRFEQHGERHAIDSSALYTGFLWVNDQSEARWEPRPNPFLLDDRIELDGSHLKVRGRETELVKILGETVNLNELKTKIGGFISQPFEIIAVANQRRGFELHLIVEGEAQVLFDDLNQQVLPYERFHKIYKITQLPRTELGKIDRSQLKKQLDLLN